MNDAPGIAALPHLRHFLHNPEVLTFPPGPGATARMQAYVYKSRRRADTYVFLAERDGFSRLPAAVAQGLGQLEFVLEVALTPERRLARADAEVVRANLAAQGFHIQFPPVPGTPDAAHG